MAAVRTRSLYVVSCVRQEAQPQPQTPRRVRIYTKTGDKGEREGEEKEKGKRVSVDDPCFTPCACRIAFLQARLASSRASVVAKMTPSSRCWARPTS